MATTSHDPLYPLTIANAIATKRSAFGLLVLTFSMQLLYLNREARELSARLTQVTNSRTANGVLPCEITELCQQMLATLKGRTHPKDGEQVQLKRVVGNAKCPMFIQGVAIPDPSAFQNGRLVLIMTEISSRKEYSAKLAKEQFHLTVREQEVIVLLEEGLTNKEIGERLRITEPTVKGHLSHIMEKTKTTTRTGLLAKILNGTENATA